MIKSSLAQLQHHKGSLYTSGLELVIVFTSSYMICRSSQLSVSYSISQLAKEFAVGQTHPNYQSAIVSVSLERSLLWVKLLPFCSDLSWSYGWVTRYPPDL